MASKIDQEKLNQLADKFKQTKTAMEKAGATEEQIQRLYDTRKDHETKIKGAGDDLAKLNRGEKIPMKGATTLGELPQKGLPDMSKQVGLGKENMWRKGLSKIGKGGVAGLALALGSSMLPEDSYAAEAADKVSDIADAADPTSRALNAIKVSDVGEGSDEVTPEMQQEMQVENERRQARREALKSLTQRDYVTQEQVPLMTGQQEEPIEDELGPVQSQPNTNRFSRVFKERMR